MERLEMLELAKAKPRVAPPPRLVAWTTL